jgi:sugar phosphate isomerase/epimerase
VAQLKIGIAVAGLNLPLAKALVAAARLGADAVELNARTELKPAELSQTGLRQLRKMLDDLKLRVSAVAYPTRRGYTVAERLEHRIAGTKEALTLAHRLGASVVVNQIGHVPPDADDPAWNLLLQALGDIGRFGERAGARLAATTGSEEGANLRRLLDALPEGAIGVDFDPGNLLANGFSPQAALDSIGSQILHVHATDGVRDLARGRGAETPVGRGAADYPALLGRLEELNYRGYFTILRRTSEEPTHEIGAAVEYLRSL